LPPPRAPCQHQQTAKPFRPAARRRSDRIRRLVIAGAGDRWYDVLALCGLTDAEDCDA